MRYNKKKKRGLSPVIANILLVALVIVIIAIIFVWFKGMIQEGITKFDKNIQLVCDDIVLVASYDSGILTIQNNGVPPIYTMKVKMIQEGEFDTQDIKDITDSSLWPAKGLKQGSVYSQPISFDEGVTEISLVPILVGTNSEGNQRVFPCEGQYEKKINV